VARAHLREEVKEIKDEILAPVRAVGEKVGAAKQRVKAAKERIGTIRIPRLKAVGYSLQC